MAVGKRPGWATAFLRETVIPYNGKECLFWPYARNSAGYAQVGSGGKTALLTRIVCEERHGPPPTPEHEAAHSCGKGHDGCISPVHLSWKTHIENMADTLKHGTHNRGERCGTSKLTETEAREIIAMRGVESQRKLAARFGVSQQTVGAIHTGRNWAWLYQEIAP